METSDSFTEFQFNATFDALKDIAKEQQEAYKEAMRK